MKEKKMVSVNAIESVMKTEFANEVEVTWHGVDIVIQKTIGMVQAFEFVNQSVNSCFADADGAYMPEMKDFVIRACLVEKYTNIRLPENSEKLYELLYKTDLCGVVCANIDKDQFDALVEAINDKLDYLSSADVKAVQKTSENIGYLVQKITDVFSDISADDVKALSDAVIGGQFNEEKLIEAYAKVKAQTPDPVEPTDYVRVTKEAGE